MHSEVSELGEDATRIVVPKGRKSDVLRMAHSSLLGGHFSICKTRGLVNRSFCWPGMLKDIKQCCTTCEVCQKAQKAPPVKATIESIARDIRII